MTIADLLLPEFEQEMAGTRKALERLPEDKLNGKAHPKSNTIGWVAAHLAEIPGWVEGTLEGESWDMNPPGGEPYQSPVVTSRKQALELFDRNVAAAQKALAGASDKTYAEKWSLLDGGKTLMTMTKYEVMRGFVINHMVHHRACLCVYYRLNGIPVPGLYGPSGDEE